MMGHLPQLCHVRALTPLHQPQTGTRDDVCVPQSDHQLVHRRHQAFQAQQTKHCQHSSVKLWLLCTSIVATQHPKPALHCNQHSSRQSEQRAMQTTKLLKKRFCCER